MINIPTELLRTLIAVVDLRSFTKAAHSLGITQPAVSAQIKRLQFLLGADLLDKSAPGVSLTSAGEVVVNYARRLLSINDQILDLATPRPSNQTLRVGMAGDFAVAQISLAAARIRKIRNDISFVIVRATFDELLREVREGELDILVALTANGTLRDAYRSWSDELVWVGAPSLHIEPGQPLPLVTYGEECIMHRVAVAALNSARCEHELVYVGPGILGITAAVAAGAGLTVLPKSRAGDFGNLAIRQDEWLPKLPIATWGIYLRDGIGHEMREQFSDAVAALVQASGGAESAAARLTLRSIGPAA